jgi:hypothetical protein
MLETLTEVGSDASWLPVKEGPSGGTGKECNQGTEQLKGHWYLPFVKNGINYVDAQGKDVISFNFTGCIMATYTPNGGSRRVCHVSTGSQQDCKAEWDKIKQSSKNVKEFKPSDAIDPKMLAGKALKGCYGIITSDDRCFAVVVGVDNKGKATVVAKKAM